MVSEQKFNFVENLGLQIIRCGPIPKHISIIMDGNRTYSKIKKITLNEVYEMGYIKLRKVLNWSIAIGIKQVSVYAFSIENFNRSEEEVTRLMNKARYKTRLMILDNDLVKNGVRVKCIGKLSLLPQDLIELMMELEEKTKDGNNLIFNLMIAYTSQDEMANSIKSNVQDVLEKKIGVEKITEKRITKCLYVSEPVDMLIRSSGVTRLSDYMMWQTTSTSFIWVKRTWPQLGFWNIIAAVFFYQYQYTKLMGVRKCLSET